MDKKYKVVSIEEPSNELEEKQAQESKEINQLRVVAVLSTINMIFSVAATPYVVGRAGDLAVVAASIFVITGMVGAIQKTKALQQLEELYNKRNEEETLEDKNDLGGKTK